MYVPRLKLLANTHSDRHQNIKPLIFYLCLTRRKMKPLMMKRSLNPLTDIVVVSHFQF